MREKYLYHKEIKDMTGEPWYIEIVLFIQRFLHALGIYQRGKIFSTFACKVRGNYWAEPLKNGFGVPCMRRDTSYSSRKHKDWWKYESTPEATMEQKYQGYKSLEEKGKLKIPAGCKGGIPTGVLPDAEEFKKEYDDFKQGKREEEQGSRELLDFEKPV